MLVFRAIVPCCIAFVVSGCGTYVPQFQENPFDKVSGQQLVQSIVFNVTCEVQDAVDKIYNNPDHPRKHTFLDKWGANIALNLQVEENTSTNPTVNWFPPSPATAIFNLAGGISVSAKATRQDKLNSYYTIQQMRELGPCNPKNRPGGVLLLQNDLGLTEWLLSNVTAADTGEIEFETEYTDGPAKTNVLSHEVKFELTNSGNLSPGWQLTRVNINQSGKTLSASRARTNDLTITLGPAAAVKKPLVSKKGKLVRDARGRVVMTTGFIPSRPAAESALASQIGLAVSNALKSSLSQ